MGSYGNIWTFCYIRDIEFFNKQNTRRDNMPIKVTDKKYKPSITATKAIEQAGLVSIQTAAVLAIVVKAIAKVDVDPMVIVEISGVIGILSGAVRAGINYFNHKDDK
jgi:hypothetical protein